MIDAFLTVAFSLCRQCGMVSSRATVPGDVHVAFLTSEIHSELYNNIATALRKLFSLIGVKFLPRHELLWHEWCECSHAHGYSTE